jgi:ABC-type transport system substrate-binding protein
MARRLMTRFGLAASVAAVVLSLTAGAALAGEITGTGKTLEPLHAHSICAYSGLNDDPTGIDPNNGPPGRVQSFGQDVRIGLIDPSAFNPGDACKGGSLGG